MAYKQEETFWHQKSRVQWLQEGDQNTKFFHAFTMQRRKRNSIEKLVTSQGVECITSDQIEQEITSSYHSLFTSSSPSQWDEALLGLQSSISNSMNQRLIRPIEDSEIKKALFSMHPTKAPGLDGMTPLFYQKYWHIVGKDICVAIKDFFCSNKMLKAVNHTVISLIPCYFLNS